MSKPIKYSFPPSGPAIYLTDIERFPSGRVSINITDTTIILRDDPRGVAILHNSNSDFRYRLRIPPTTSRYNRLPHSGPVPVSYTTSNSEIEINIPTEVTPQIARNFPRRYGKNKPMTVDREMEVIHFPQNSPRSDPRFALDDLRQVVRWFNELQRENPNVRFVVVCNGVSTEFQDPIQLKGKIVTVETFE